MTREERLREAAGCLSRSVALYFKVMDQESARGKKRANLDLIGFSINTVKENMAAVDAILREGLN